MCSKGPVDYFLPLECVKWPNQIHRNQKPFQCLPFIQSIVNIQIKLFGSSSSDDHKVLVVGQVKQPWHETTHFPLFGKDQKPNVSQKKDQKPKVSQTLLLFTLEGIPTEIPDMIWSRICPSSSSDWVKSFGAFFVRFRKENGESLETDQGHCGGNLGEGSWARFSFHVGTFLTQISFGQKPNKYRTEIFIFNKLRVNDNFWRKFIYDYFIN